MHASNKCQLWRRNHAKGVECYVVQQQLRLRVVARFRILQSLKGIPLPVPYTRKSVLNSIASVQGGSDLDGASMLGTCNSITMRAINTEFASFEAVSTMYSCKKYRFVVKIMAQQGCFDSDTNCNKTSQWFRVPSSNVVS